MKFIYSIPYKKCFAGDEATLSGFHCDVPLADTPEQAVLLRIEFEEKRVQEAKDTIISWAENLNYRQRALNHVRMLTEETLSNNIEYK